MAVNYTNDSYNRCIAELRARYTGRGVSVSARRTAAQQEATEVNMLAASSDSYMGFDKASGISNEYRSGEYRGNKYMTSDDFVRYFRNRSNYNMPLALRNAQQSMKDKAQKPGAVVASRGGSRRDTLVPSESSSKEGHLKTRVERFVAKWFPIEPREGRTIGEKFRFPTAAIGSMAAFALSLGLIVGGSVMIGSASGEVGTLNSEISRLETKQTELQSELDLKYNIQDIEKEAKSLGMINREYADKAYIDVGSDEKIEIYEQEEKNVGFAALLNALGIKTN